MTDLAAFLKAKRTAAGLSLAECARRAKLSKGYLSTLESIPTDPGLYVLDKLASVYGLRAGDLLVEAGYTVNPTIPPLYCLDTRTGRVWPVAAAPDAPTAGDDDTER